MLFEMLRTMYTTAPSSLSSGSMVNAWMPRVIFVTFLGPLDYPTFAARFGSLQWKTIPHVVNCSDRFNLYRLPLAQYGMAYLVDQTVSKRKPIWWPPPILGWIGNGLQAYILNSTVKFWPVYYFRDYNNLTMSRTSPISVAPVCIYSPHPSILRVPKNWIQNYMLSEFDCPKTPQFCRKRGKISCKWRKQRVGVLTQIAIW